MKLKSIEYIKGEPIECGKVYATQNGSMYAKWVNIDIENNLKEETINNLGKVSTTKSIIRATEIDGVIFGNEIGDMGISLTIQEKCFTIVNNHLKYIRNHSEEIQYQLKQVAYPELCEEIKEFIVYQK